MPMVWHDCVRKDAHTSLFFRASKELLEERVVVFGLEYLQAADSSVNDMVHIFSKINASKTGHVQSISLIVTVPISYGYGPGPRGTPKQRASLRAWTRTKIDCSRGNRPTISRPGNI